MTNRHHRTIDCDLLVIGGGGAGAIAAAEASGNPDLRVILAAKGPIGRSGLTPTANGGTHTNTSPEEMFREAVVGGCFLNDQNLVWHMCREIRPVLKALQDMDIPVVPLSPTAVALPPVETLRKFRAILAERPNAEIMEDVLITRLFRTAEGICGAAAMNLASGEIFAIQASAVILATGGLVGELYPHTSNNPFGLPTHASGTGAIMAFEAGAELMDLEMVQIVPLPANPRALHLRFFPDFWGSPYHNGTGEIIEDNVNAYLDGSYHHEFVRKLQAEIEAGRGPIYVDCRGAGKTARPSPIAAWKRRRELIANIGIDPAENRIEILLGSHFCMGGARVDETTRTSVPGLFAAGEIMAGVHGAMRLSGNSFSQMIVFGFEAGRQAAALALSRGKPEAIPYEEMEAEAERLLKLLEPGTDPVSIRDLKKELQNVMQAHAFVVRDHAGLELGMSKIRGIRERAARIRVSNFRSYNLEWQEAIEFGSILTAADLIVRCALARQESRGVHFRRDFPEQNDRDWLRHTLIERRGDRVEIKAVPVDLSRLKPEGLS